MTRLTAAEVGGLMTVFSAMMLIISLLAGWWPALAGWVINLAAWSGLWWLDLRKARDE